MMALMVLLALALADWAAAAPDHLPPVHDENAPAEVRGRAHAPEQGSQASQGAALAQRDSAVIFCAFYFRRTSGRSHILNSKRRDSMGDGGRARTPPACPPSSPLEHPKTYSSGAVLPY